MVVPRDRSRVTITSGWLSANSSTFLASAENPWRQPLVSSPAMTRSVNTGGSARPVRLSTCRTLRTGLAPPYPVTTTTPSR